MSASTNAARDQQTTTVAANDDNSGASAVAKDLFAGTVSGMAQVLTGQPFDIVKVRLQSSDAYTSTWNCASRILKEEGPTAFYKGTAMPLVGIGACVSLQFAFLQAGKRYFISKNALNGSKSPETLSLPQLYLAGAVAGAGNSVVSGPVEHIRIRLQTQATKLYNGPVDALMKIYRSDGLRGIYQGQTATLAREFHGYGAYFLTYEYLVQQEMERNQIQRKQIPMSSAILYGAAAGYAMWLTNYPLDVVKSRLQTDGFPSSTNARSNVEGKVQRKYKGPIDCARQLWNTQGWRGFFRGLTPTLIRSPFVNGATFAVFELTMKFIT